MEFSVRKRIGRILENTHRIQELAGLDQPPSTQQQYSSSDPEAGYVAPPNAYEDDYAGLQKRFGNGIIDKIELFVEKNLNIQLVQTGMQGTDINLKKSPSPNTNQSPDMTFDQSTDVFIRFGGYMVDARNYVFNVGCKDHLGEDIFAYRFVMDINGNFNNWQKSGFGN